SPLSAFSSAREVCSRRDEIKSGPPVRLIAVGAHLPTEGCGRAAQARDLEEPSLRSVVGLPLAAGEVRALVGGRLRALAAGEVGGLVGGRLRTLAAGEVAAPGALLLGHPTPPSISAEEGEESRNLDLAVRRNPTDADATRGIDDVPTDRGGISVSVSDRLRRTARDDRSQPRCTYRI